MDATPRVRPGAWWPTTLLACAHLALSYALTHPQFLVLDAFAYGRERTPYQYRVLTAWIMRPLGEIPDLVRFAARTPFGNPYVLAEAVLAGLAILGTVLATRRSLEILLGDRPFAAWASLLVVLLAHFQYGLPYGLDYVTPYDLPGLALFSLAVLGIVARNRPLYYVAFALGTLNRETMLFATVPFAVWELQGERAGGWKTLAPHLAAQIALWGILKGLVAQSLASRTPIVGDSGLLEVHLLGNLKSLLNPYQWPLLASAFGFTLPFVVANRRRIADARLRRTLTILLPLWGAAMMVVGVIVEIRVFGEMIAVVALAVAAIVHSWLGERRALDPTPTPPQGEGHDTAGGRAA